MFLFLVLIRSIASLVFLFLLTKLTGPRQIADMNMFDYINGITIGSIAAEMAMRADENILKPALAMAIYAVGSFAASIIMEKKPKSRDFFIGRTLLLYENGKFQKKNFQKARLSVAEFLESMRILGQSDLSRISRIYMEPCGQFSIQPKECWRPTAPLDLGVYPVEPPESLPVITDGEICPGSLRKLGLNEQWLKNQLAHQKAAVSDVFLAIGKRDASLEIYLTDNKDNKQ